MKKIICLLFICVSLYNAFSQKSKVNTFILTGSITEAENPVVYLIYTDQSGNSIEDSCRLQQGKFWFKGYIKEPTWAIFRGNIKIMDDAENPNIVDIFLEPGDITATAQYNHIKKIKIIGSKTQLEYEMLQKQYDAIDQNSDSLYEKFSNMNKAFIINHPNSYVSAYQLSTYKTRWTIDSVKSVYKHLKPKIQNSFYGKGVKETIGEIDNNAEGRTAEDFRTTDIKGKSISLSDFKGKYVLLDFWGSWCVPCRQSTPHLIDLFEKYHNFGLDVIGIAQERDRTGVAWKAAVKKDGTDKWFNVLSIPNADKNKGKGDAQSIVKKFGVQVFPTKILIDRTGIIIGRYTGTDDEAVLDKRLGEIFK